MAETLTYENTTETTSIDNLSEAEQDSLKVGEALQEEQETLLAGKYKDAQELESAYIELQKKLGDKDEEKPSETEAEVESKDTDEKKEDEPESTILDDLWAQTLDDQTYKDETIKALQGIDPADIAKMHLEYRAQNQQTPTQFTEQDVKQLHDLAGGEDGYKEMLGWATKNLNKQEVDMFDQVMERGDALAAFFAVRSLAYRWEDAKGYDGRMLTGTAPKTDGSQFRSQQEVVAAMNDPRYDRDPAYRQDVTDKLRRSDVKF